MQHTSTSNKFQILEQNLVRISMIAWGERAIHQMLEYALPSIAVGLKQSGLVKQHRCTFCIYTRQHEISQIAKSPIISVLRQTVDIEFVNIEIEESEHYKSVSKIHARITNEAQAASAYAVFLQPNSVYSIEVFDAIATAVMRRRSALFLPSLRGKFESLSAELDQQKSEAVEGRSLTARKMVALAFRHLHPEEKRLYWGSWECAAWISRLYFPVDGNTLIAACWHLCPVMIQPVGRVSDKGTVDNSEFLATAGVNLNQIEVITDSDLGFFIDFDSGNSNSKAYASKHLSIRACARWAHRHALLLHRTLFVQLMMIHTNETDRLAFNPAYRFASEITMEIAREYDRVHTGWLGRLIRTILSPFALARAAVRLIRWGMRLARSIFRRQTFRWVNKVVFDLKASLALRNFVKKLFLENQFSRGALHMFFDVMAKEVARKGSTEREDNVVGRFTYERGLRRMDEGDLEEALTLVRAAILLAPQPDKIFYENLITTLIQLQAKAYESARRIKDKWGDSPEEPLIFAVVVWGEHYVSAFLDYTVRSMLAPGNLPALESRRLIFSIVTDENSQPLFERNALYQELKKLVTVEFFIFPSKLTTVGHYSDPNFNFYRLYGALDHTSIHFSRALGGHIFFVVADSLFANGSLSNLLKYLDQGYEVCVNASLVANKETLLPLLDGRVDSSGVLNLSSLELANICFQHRHDYISQRLVIPSNINFDKYPRELYFPSREGLLVHALYQHPWVISAKAISRNIRFDYHIVDFRLISRIFENSASYEKLKVIEDSAEVFIANFAPKVRNFETTGTAFNERNFVNAHLHSQPIHWHIWSHQQIIRCDVKLESNLNPALVAGDVLVALRKAIQK